MGKCFEKNKVKVLSVSLYIISTQPVTDECKDASSQADAQLSL